MNDYIVDLALLLIFGLITLLYSKKGFVKTILDSVTLALAVVGAKFLSEPAYNVIKSNTTLLSNMNETVANVAVFVLLFIALCILLKWLFNVIDKVFKLPVLKQVNGFLGLILGIVCAAVAVIIICLVLQVSVNVVYNEQYVTAIENSKIVSLIVNNEKILTSLKF